MTTGFGALRDDDVGADVRRRSRVLDVGDHHHDANAALVAPRDEIGIRQSEADAPHSDALVEHHVDRSRQHVRTRRRRGRRLRHVNLSPDLVQHGVDGRDVGGRERSRIDRRLQIRMQPQVDAERRAASQLAQLANLRA